MKFNIKIKNYLSLLLFFNVLFSFINQIVETAQFFAKLQAFKKRPNLIKNLYFINDLRLRSENLHKSFF